MAFIETLLLLVLLLFIIIVVGTPVAFAIGFVAVTGIYFLLPPSHFIQIGNVVYSEGTNINQLIVPLFLLMAEFLAQGGIASDLFTVLSKWLKKIKSGLGVGAILACTIFAALCGSSPATAAAVGRISIKEMVKRNWNENFAIGLVAAGGTIGIMIPPSIPLAIFGIITETSIVKLFMAGILPGLLNSFLLIVFILIRAKLNPKLVGAGTENAGHQDESPPVDLDKFKLAELKKDLLLMLPPIALIVLILSVLYLGIATPTEMAGVGVIGALIIIAINKKINSGVLVDVFKSTARSSSMVMFLLFGGMSLSYLVSYLGISQELAGFMTATIANKWLIIMIVYAIWFILGMIIDPMSMIILTIPFIFSTLVAYGFDPIWIGIVSTLCIEIAMITPPVGMNLFILTSVTGTPMKEVSKGTIPFVMVLIISLILLTIFPQIALYLPSRM